MVESGRDYVLQWNGHAAHVMERFSGLLARQALVDVTLICQGQRLRVHKLVLASSSLYFEEMLEQDLGQEPIILLRDLDFEVLKAMVEFMYCGETTISQCHLQTLLDAAQVFKVKELKCIVESVIKSKIPVDKVTTDLEKSSPIIDAADVRKNSYIGRPSGERCDENCLSSHYEESEKLENKSDRLLDNNSRIIYNEDENSMYEISKETGNQAPCENEEEESSDRASLDNSDSETSKMSTSEDNDEEDKEGSLKIHKISCFHEDNALKSLYAETHCCKYIDETEPRVNTFSENSTKNRNESKDLPRAVGECSRVYTHKKRKFIENDELSLGSIQLIDKIEKNDDNFPEDSQKSEEPDDKNVGKNLKVYSHKRRKSVDDKRPQIFDNVSDSMEEPTSTSSIDLNDDASFNETPISLSTSLDMETSEYIWNLSTETIQYVVGCTINSENTSISKQQTKKNSQDTKIDNNRDELDVCDGKKSRRMKELFSCENGDRGISNAPVLRRSVRINQLESDDSLNNNNGTLNITKEREKSLDLEKDDYANSVTLNLTKTRRRVKKDPNFCIIDENIVVSPSSLEKTANSRALRSRTKLSPRKCDNSRRDERKKNTRQNREKIEKIDSSDILVNTRLNTTASVDRALWGDMSDVLENREDSNEELLNQATSREIPFAVGLLPLRAALERMQATLDHQPRKTRSSVAPWRQEAISQKRKLSEYEEAKISGNARKHAENENVKRAVCHIEIRTSTSRNDIENREISTDEKIIAVGPNAESNEQ